MIVDALLYILCMLLEALYALLPSWEFSLDNTVDEFGHSISIGDQQGIDLSDKNAIAAGFSILAVLNNYLPISHLLNAGSFVLTVIGASLAFRGVRWIINVVRGAGA